MVELVGNMHMHTPYSDGEKYHRDIAVDAIKAGLDFIIVTDHNVWVDGVEGFYEHEEQRVLLLAGEEVHNVRRRPQASHFLAYGADRELAPFAHDPQKLIDETNAAGGYGFLAHPHELDLPIFPEGDDLGWHDWEIEGYTGIELWNYMSSFKNEAARFLEQFPFKQATIARLRLLPMALNPQKIVTAPEKRTLAFWDEMLADGKRVVVVGNSDAHGTPMSMGPIHREIFPYEFLFRAVNTHVLVDGELTGEIERDKPRILRAIGEGHSWVGYDMAHPTQGFRFTGQSRNKGTMGDEIRLDAGATLQVITPAKSDIRLICGGEVVAEAMNEDSLTHYPIEPGAYRVECHKMYEGKKRGWIYSNPIYLV